MTRTIDWRNAAAVFGGGAVGGVLRYGLSLGLADTTTLMGTTVVNLLGSFGLAFLTAATLHRWPLADWVSLALGTGLIGGFTTFSTLMLSVGLGIAAGRWAVVAVLVVNLLGGLAAAALGRRLGVGGRA
ncbi:fluoride efflux transporter FluC [Lacticaseibacillus kribbianus]|uniref:fluoride efflux transporter FluC n=1 Tax=Lacticaseibacillus kribbianus TaxID=2926292 RepID=UPI001CD25059|nr:CrcB family protein [Lacticaseibacillus kribbianus]